MVIPFFYRGQSGVVTAISKGVSIFSGAVKITKSPSLVIIRVIL